MIFGRIGAVLSGLSGNATSIQPAVRPIVPTGPARFGPIVTFNRPPLAFTIMIDRLYERTWGLQHWLCLMLVASFALRSLVAPGYMPSIAAGSNKPLKLVICTAQGVKTIPVSDSDATPDGHDGPATGSDCGFAGLAPLAHWAHPDLLLTGNTGPTLDVAFAIVAPREPVRRVGPLLGSRGPPAAA